MDRARELRENAARGLRLSDSVNAPADVACLKALAAEAIQSAERIEAEEAAAGVVEYGVRCSAEEHRGAARAGNGAFEGSDAVTSREVKMEPDTLTDRRRTGRRDDVSPVLIPLLREDSITSIPTSEAAIGGPDDLRASRGIIIWVLVSVAIWVPLAYRFIGRGR
jgi:hypothetical protein